MLADCADCAHAAVDAHVVRRAAAAAAIVMRTRLI
jgi:hypothetical protein